MNSRNWQISSTTYYMGICFLCGLACLRQKDLSLSSPSSSRGGSTEKVTRSQFFIPRPLPVFTLTPMKQVFPVMFKAAKKLSKVLNHQSIIYLHYTVFICLSLYCTILLKNAWCLSTNIYFSWKYMLPTSLKFVTPFIPNYRSFWHIWIYNF